MPFNSQLLKLLDESNDFENYNRSKAERKILVDCLTFVPKFGNKVVQEWIKTIESDKGNDTNVPATNEKVDVKVYSKAHLENMPKLEGFEKYGVKSVLKEKKDYEHANRKASDKDKLVGMITNDKASEEINAASYCPNFLRPVPEVDPSLENSIVEDAIWLFPGVLPEPCWDYTLGNNTSRVKTLMKKSLSGPLKKSNTELIINTFRSDPEAVLHYGIHPENLPMLIIHNKDLAMEFFNCMVPFPIITKYYMVLAQTKVNLNSMELFNKLVQNHELPQEYILFYVYNCKESCKDEASVNYKNRLVRLISIVISFLLKSKVIPVEELLKLKVDEFFEEYNNIKEAAVVLKQIKS